MNSDDPRAKRTRQLLQQAFIDLMDKHGFHAVTVQRIAAKAQVNRATFYAHFVDKYQLIDVLIRDALQQQLAKKLSTPTALTKATLHVLVSTVFEFREHLRCRWAVNDKQLKALFVITMQEELHDIVRSWLKHTTPSHVAEASAVELSAAFVSWAICGVGFQQTEVSSQTIEAQVEQVVELLSEGMRLS